MLITHLKSFGKREDGQDLLDTHSRGAHRAHRDRRGRLAGGAVNTISPTSPRLERRGVVVAGRCAACRHRLTALSAYGGAVAMQSQVAVTC